MDSPSLVNGCTVLCWGGGEWMVVQLKWMSLEDPQQVSLKHRPFSRRGFYFYYFFVQIIQIRNSHTWRMTSSLLLRLDFQTFLRKLIVYNFVVTTMILVRLAVIFRKGSEFFFWPSWRFLFVGQCWRHEHTSCPASLCDHLQVSPTP